MTHHRGRPAALHPFRNAFLFDALNGHRTTSRTTETNPAASARHSLVVRLIVRRLLHLRFDPTGPNPRRCIHTGFHPVILLSPSPYHLLLFLVTQKKKKKKQNAHTLLEDSIETLFSPFPKTKCHRSEQTPDSWRTSKKGLEEVTRVAWTAFDAPRTRSSSTRSRMKKKKKKEEEEESSIDHSRRGSGEEKLPRCCAWTVSKLNENPHQTLSFLFRFYTILSRMGVKVWRVSGRTGWWAWLQKTMRQKSRTTLSASCRVSNTLGARVLANRACFRAETASPRRPDAQWRPHRVRPTAARLPPPRQPPLPPSFSPLLPPTLHTIVSAPKCARSSRSESSERTTFSRRPTCPCARDPTLALECARVCAHPALHSLRITHRFAYSPENAHLPRSVNLHARNDSRI